MLLCQLFMLVFVSAAIFTVSNGQGTIRPILDTNNKNDGNHEVGCQHLSTKGRDYFGRANTTTGGTPCEKWTKVQANDYTFESMEDHNYCRNPFGTFDDRERRVVWCYANVSQKKTRRIDCGVPKCPPLKVLDFSQDNDGKLDGNNRSTYATLWITKLPSSFTICSAFMVDKWDLITKSVIFNLFDKMNSNIMLVDPVLIRLCQNIKVGLP